MTKEQGKTYDYCVRLDFPMEQGGRGPSEIYSSSEALEVFEGNLSEKGKPFLKILRTPKLLPEYKIVTLVFSVRLEQPEASPDIDSELQKQIETHYFNAFPPEWKLDILSKIADGEYVSYF